MTAVWMLDDLEPWPNAPAVGDVFAPTTHWLNNDAAGEVLPADVLSTLKVTVRERLTETGAEWEAELDDGFTTMLPNHPPELGDATIQGCLV